MNIVTREIEDFCKQVGITPAQFTGEVPIKGNLEIKDNITIPPGFSAIIGWNLDLPKVTTIQECFSPVVGGFLSLDSATNIAEGFTPFVGHSLFLKKATTLLEGFAPIVGGDLVLNKVRTIQADFAPVVRGSLQLCDIISYPVNCTPIVGDTLYLDGKRNMEVKKLDRSKPLETRAGKYILVDDWLMEVMSKSGNVWRARHIGEDQVFYLVTDGSGHFAHGNTLVDARNSLIYKISNRDISEYKNLSEESELSFPAAIKMYRSITGACAAGVRHYIESHNIKKKRYTIKDIIKMTTGQYGHEQLVKFFNV